MLVISTSPFASTSTTKEQSEQVTLRRPHQLSIKHEFHRIPRNMLEMRSCWQVTLLWLRTPQCQSPGNTMQFAIKGQTKNRRFMLSFMLMHLSLKIVWFIKEKHSSAHVSVFLSYPPSERIKENISKAKNNRTMKQNIYNFMSPTVLSSREGNQAVKCQFMCKIIMKNLQGQEPPQDRRIYPLDLMARKEY